MKLPAAEVQDPAAQQNFEFIDGLLAGAVTALPTRPFDGQEVAFLADATKGVQWRFRYRAASTNTQKWEFVGGPPLRVEAVGGTTFGTYETTTSTTFTTLATGGPSIVAPLAGVYDCIGKAACVPATGGNLAGALIWATGDGAGVSWQQADLFSLQGAMEMGRRERTLAKGDTVELRYATSNVASAGQFYNRSLYITPVRVA